MKKIVVSILLCVVAMVSCSKQERVLDVHSIHDLDKSIRASLGEPIKCDTILVRLTRDSIQSIKYVYDPTKVSFTDAVLYMCTAYSKILDYKNQSSAYLLNDKGKYRATVDEFQPSNSDSTYIYIYVNDIDNELGLISENGK